MILVLACCYLAWALRRTDDVKASPPEERTDQHIGGNWEQVGTLSVMTLDRPNSLLLIGSDPKEPFSISTGTWSASGNTLNLAYGKSHVSGRFTLKQSLSMTLMDFHGGIWLRYNDEKRDSND